MKAPYPDGRLRLVSLNAICGHVIDVFAPLANREGRGGWTSILVFYKKFFFHPFERDGIKSKCQGMWIPIWIPIFAVFVCGGLLKALANWLSGPSSQQFIQPTQKCPLAHGTKVSDCNTKKGSISLIMGPMFSGKTDELLRQVRVRRFSSDRRGLKCLLIKYQKDKRYHSDAVSSHHTQIFDQECVQADRLSDVQHEAQSADYIFIDEGQFYDDLTSTCVAWARAGKQITIAALDATSNQILWPQITTLIPWCNDVRKMQAICELCGLVAALSKSLVVKETVQIGGRESYYACCINSSCLKELSFLGVTKESRNDHKKTD